MWEVRAEAKTDAPPEAVWELWDDPGRWKEWNDEVASVRADGPLRTGATIRIRLKRSPPQRYTVTAYEPNRLLTDETRLPGARVGHEHLVEDGRIVHRLYIDGPLEKLWAGLLGWRMRSAVRTFGPRERDIAEGRAGATAEERLNDVVEAIRRGAGPALGAATLTTEPPDVVHVRPANERACPLTVSIEGPRLVTVELGRHSTPWEHCHDTWPEVVQSVEETTAAVVRGQYEEKVRVAGGNLIGAKATLGGSGKPSRLRFANSAHPRGDARELELGYEPY